MDSNYDDLENSIVESLSEMSIASNAMLNTTTTDLINKTINEVISLYLWSDSFLKYNSSDEENDGSRPLPKPRIRLASDEDGESSVKNAWDMENSHRSKHDRMNKKDNSNNIKVVYEEEIENETPKPSPRKVTTNNPKKIQSDSHFLNEDSQSKMQIPLLDFTALSESNKNRNANTTNNNNTNIKKKEESLLIKDLIKNIEKKSNSNEQNSTKLDIKKQITPINSANRKNNQYENSTRKNTFKNTKLEIKSLLKDLKLIKNLNLENNDYYDETVEQTKTNKIELTDKVRNMEIDLRDLLSKLLEKRKLSKRNQELDKMTREEMLAEKVDTQKELLTFEGKHGRPQSKLEKDLMRPLYDHYRKVKRFLSKFSSSDTNGQTDDDYYPNDDYLNNKEQLKNMKYLQSLKAHELQMEKDALMQEKLKLKDVIRKYESDFIQINGRSLLKDDREYYKDDFEKYKLLKSKIKNIELLLEKQKSN